MSNVEDVVKKEETKVKEEIKEEKVKETKAKETKAKETKAKEKKKTPAKKTTKKTRGKKKYLVIVESPAKASTIGKFLGTQYKIEASMGHIRDLPKSQMGIDIENDFEPRYITIRGKGDLLAKLRIDAKNAEKIYLATDPDREGEAISWHLIHALHLSEGKDVRRITFNEITQTAVMRSITEAREIDMDLVNAQQARRVLDRMVGYTVSKLLWSKVKKGLSGGRVQSVALRIICDKEDEIRAFIPTEYWSLATTLKGATGNLIETKFYGQHEKKMELNNEAETQVVVKGIENQPFEVTEVKTGIRNKKPVAPFTTSTLQQEASKHLNMATQKTMLIAQQLYEGVTIQGKETIGLVSYIRTDSFRISDEAYDSVVAYIEGRYGKEFVNPDRIVYKSKGKTQDAHEAIRPTDVLRTPESIKEFLSKDQFRLYKLIWDRFVASQMSPAVYHTLSMKLVANTYDFRSSGSRLKFKGFLEVYHKGQEENEKMIPSLEEGEVLEIENILTEQHFTQAPSRFTDASLIKTLEEIGVGRPSTYAPTITTIQARHYVVKEAKNLYPTELGEVVNDIMRSYFGNIIDIDFTANMEERLDEVEEGQEEWKQVIRDFYPDFQKAVDDATEQLAKIEIKDEETDVLCEKCGKNMVIKYGRYGKFLACPGFPECQNAKPFFEDAKVACPKCSGKVLIKKTKKGRTYYGCENQPEECEFLSWNKPSEKKCPECGDYLEEKGKKNVKLVCANEKCSYVEEKIEASNQEEENQAEEKN